MKKRLLTVALVAFSSVLFAQNRSSLWNATTKKSTMVALESRMQLPENQIFNLNLDAIHASLATAPRRMANGNITGNQILMIPNADGIVERYRVVENSIMAQELQDRYPEIRSYIGENLDSPGTTAYFSVSPLGFKAMMLKPGKSAEFIEPISADLTTYTVYRKSDRANAMNRFECSVVDAVNTSVDNGAIARPNADDATLRTFRLAMSCTGEYAVYFGGTKALALAAINNSITRCNGIFEKDFGVKMQIIANTDLVLYTSASTDPYSAAASMSSWNAQLQSTLTSVIGEANYDVGHLFGATGGGGNAGCIGCVCVNGSKGSGITSPADGIPSGDNFDVDYVAHELGHQFGANHTFTHSNEGTGVQMEPGSGSTIMGYAGITSLDVQPHSDAYFHAASIQQVTNNIKAKTCQTNTATGNSVPTANAGLDYTVPKSTPFMLTGSATDANGDVLTYNWEQMDSQTTSTSPSATKTSGVNFRSYNSSTSPTRYFPRMASVLTGATTTAGSALTVEALPSVARTLNFRMTVRDNRATGAANNSDDAIVTVNATAGPFSVSSPNTAVSYTGGTSQTVTWAVAGTTANGVNCANVDVLISTNGGTTWSTILAATPNDGTEAVTMPNTPSTTCRIMVKGTNHIFFDVSNTNFTLTAGSTDTIAPTAPILAASGTTQTTTSLSWSGATDNVAVTGYDVYRGTTLLGTTASTTFAVSGLTASTTYSFTVKAKDAAGNISIDSNVVSVTTLAPVVDTTAPTAATLSASGTTTSTTNLSWSGATDNVAVTGYDVYRNGTLLASTTTATTYSVTGLTAATTYTFTVRAKDAAGNISVDSNTVSVTTSAVTISYCTASATNTNDERIGRVQFGTINNPSTGTAGYENFTAISTNVVRGSANTITITPTWTSTVYSEAYRVYIDYNQNGVFTDAGESVYSKAGSTATTATGTITIPTTATLGATRMRVIMRYSTTPTTSCGTFTYGQVEDYTINITATAKMNDTSLSFNVFPNPVEGDILNISSIEKPTTYKIYNLMGQQVATGKVDNNAVFVGSLTAGTYMIEISDETTSSVAKRFIKK
jgi:chitodextrinase